jgi:HAD superfamily hydrolase (TIGR01509 family)
MVDFDLVIFDCDGVLIDSEMLSVAADVACLAEYGIEMPADEILERYTGVSFADMLTGIEARFGRSLPGFAERHRVRLRELFTGRLQAIEGVTSVLDSLSCSRCVASSGTHERLQHALTLVGLYERFYPHIFSAADVARGKPAPDLFLLAAERMRVVPRRCVVIEDSLPGVAAAVAAGMTAIGFTGGSHCRPGHGARLAAEGANVVVGRMAELLPVLRHGTAAGTLAASLT